MHALAIPAHLLLATATLAWLVLPLAALFCKRDTNHAIWSILIGTGSAAMLGAALSLHSTRADVHVPIGFGAVFASFRFDPLASWFLCIISVVGLLLPPYLREYLGHLPKRSVDLRVVWLSLGLLLASMAATVAAANAQTFLVAWEIMSLSSFLLVATAHDLRGTRHAALVYLGATRVGTAFLAMGFLWSHALTHTWTFSDWHLTGLAALGPGMLILVGLGVKAGMWPFHLWLPIAHPAAPSPVSALMSGVMVKVAIAAIVRFFVVGSSFSHPAFGYAILCLGAIGALWGVLFALLQHDLKRLLAFHTVENVGLILMGVGVSIIARRAGLELTSEIALAAALYHVLNHALFKSLLFLGAGAVDVAAGTRELGMLGGLGRRMPWTFACFTIGAAAICGLPPLNGFASEWLLYQSFLHMGGVGVSPLIRFASLLLIGLIALVGALALACFIKAVAVVFQGRPRSSRAETACEGGLGMCVSQTSLAACCAILGLSAPAVLRMLEPIVAPSTSPAAGLESVWTLPIGALTVVLLTTAAALALWMDRAGRRMPARVYVTWECGFGELSPRAQVAGASFVQPIARMFRVVFRYAENLRIEGVDRRLFPEEIVTTATSESVLETKIYSPAVRWFGRLGSLILRLQQGSIHRYLLTMVITLIVLLAIGGYTR